MAEVPAFAPVEEQKVISHDNGVPESPPPHKMTAKEYCLTRFSTLKPPMNHAPNPIRLLMLLNGRQWLFFLVAFLAWVSLCFFGCFVCIHSRQIDALTGERLSTNIHDIHTVLGRV